MLASWYSKDEFLGVELYLKMTQVVKCFLEIFQKGTALLRLHHNIIYIDVGISAKLLEEAFLHATLKSGTGISQAECHSQVAESSEWCDESGLQAVSRIQIYLVVA